MSDLNSKLGSDVLLNQSYILATKDNLVSLCSGKMREFMSISKNCATLKYSNFMPAILSVEENISRYQG
jgi:hypothetical protein